jgi:hypothetical protein
MKTKVWVVRNDFHRTHVRVRTLNNGLLSEKAAARIRRQLCPVAGCRCSGNAIGTRGRQTVWIAAGPLPGWFWLEDVEGVGLSLRERGPLSRSERPTGVRVPERVTMGGLFDED